MTGIDKKMAWFAALNGSAVPAFSTFFALVPPLFPQIGLLTAALAGAVMVIVGRRAPSDTAAKSIRRGARILAVAVTVLCAYVICFVVWTVEHPRADKRYQIGFRTLTWSLTDAGRRDLAARPGATPAELMMMEGAYTVTNDGPFKIWAGWSIYVAATILLMLYLTGFLLWTGGFVMLAKVPEESK